jgi:hypothetical protein
VAAAAVTVVAALLRLHLSRQPLLWQLADTANVIKFNFKIKYILKMLDLKLYYCGVQSRSPSASELT